VSEYCLPCVKDHRHRRDRSRQRAGTALHEATGHGHRRGVTATLACGWPESRPVAL
jgi:hypothetical protein